jgi:hypothetical protein
MDTSLGLLSNALRAPLVEQEQMQQPAVQAAPEPWDDALLAASLAELPVEEAVPVEAARGAERRASNPFARPKAAQVAVQTHSLPPAAAAAAAGSGLTKMWNAALSSGFAWIPSPGKEGAREPPVAAARSAKPVSRANGSIAKFLTPPPVNAPLRKRLASPDSAASGKGKGRREGTG